MLLDSAKTNLKGLFDIMQEQGNGDSSLLPFSLLKKIKWNKGDGSTWVVYSVRGSFSLNGGEWCWYAPHLFSNKSFPSMPKENIVGILTRLVKWSSVVMYLVVIHSNLIITSK